VGEQGTVSVSPIWPVSYPMVVFDQEGTIRDANESFNRCIPHQDEALSGANLAQILFPNDPARFAELLTTLSHSGDGKRPTVEVELSGKIFRADIFALPGGESRIETPLLTTVLIDITREKQIEQQKADFTSMIVHDLRGPLTAIMGVMELVVASWDKGLKESYRDMLANGVKESLRMSGLIDELLDIAKIESGKFTIDSDRIRIGPVVRRAVSSMDNIAQREGILLESVIEPQLPTVMGDEDKLTQVLINLLSNAIKFTPRKGMVCVFAEHSGGSTPEIRITVTDTGTGIDQAEAEKLFSRYSQADNQQAAEGKKMGGTGLGLYIVKELVEAHGGRIALASEKGLGTSMIFTLPLSD
jgi:PAS domain S-box-containing protein